MLPYQEFPKCAGLFGNLTHTTNLEILTTMAVKKEREIIADLVPLIRKMICHHFCSVFEAKYDGEI